MSYSPKIQPWPEEFSGKLPVSELFYSIQGEGRFAGHPALFVRLKYCNLGCAWCDTRFTWEAGSIEPGKILDPEEITDKAIELLPANYEPASVHVVITGGEPMLHQERIPALIGSLESRGFCFFEIETNGMFEPTNEMLDKISWWNCSPKLSNNGLVASQNIVPSALSAIGRTGRCDFKFVVQSRRDLEELEASYLPLISKERMMLMPEGTTPERIIQVSSWLMEECRIRGYRFSPRLHIMAWGNERGR